MTPNFATTATLTAAPPTLCAHWSKSQLLQEAIDWCGAMRKQRGAVNEYSTWWQFIPFFEKQIDKWLTDFCAGKHQFAPLNHYKFINRNVETRFIASNKSDLSRAATRRDKSRLYRDGKSNSDVVYCFSYLDRLMLHLIHTIIRPTFKHLISPFCFHLKGPSQIKIITQMITAALTLPAVIPAEAGIQNPGCFLGLDSRLRGNDRGAVLPAALNTGRFKYCMRIDIKSYYASINHRVLLDQVKQNFDDPMILQYLETVITTAIDSGGRVFLPTQGIPQRSPLSPFFGALYLAPLDQAFTTRKDVFYCRYVDDIIILVETKRQYTQARKRLFSVLKNLKLKVSPSKTRMGALNDGFHFLGVKFAVPRSTATKNQSVVVTVHNRTPRRALARVQALSSNAVNPAHIQRYLTLWSNWWRQVVKTTKQELFIYWVACIPDDDLVLKYIGKWMLDFKLVSITTPTK